MKKEKLLKKVREKIHAYYPSAKILLFGSRARGDFKENSDWDLLILIKKKISENEKLKIHHLIYEIELKTDELINSIVHTEEEWSDPLMQFTPFYKNVVTEGIVL